MSNKYPPEIEKIVSEIIDLFEDFILEATYDKFTKLSQKKARKHNVDLRKKLKKFNAISIKYTRIKSKNN